MSTSARDNTPASGKAVPVSYFMNSNVAGSGSHGSLAALTAPAPTATDAAGTQTSGYVATFSPI